MKKIVLLVAVLLVLTACQAALPAPPQQQFAENALGFDVVTTQVKGCTAGTAVVRRDGTRYIDDRGRQLPYDEMTETNGAGAIVVRTGNKYGIVNKELELVIPAVYDSILQAKSWSVGSPSDYVVPPMFYLFQGDSIYSLDWGQGLLAAFSQSIDDPQYRYEDFSVAIAQGELPFATYSGTLDCSVEWLLPGFRNAEFTLCAPTGEAIKTAIANPFPDGFQDGLDIDFGDEGDQYLAVLGAVTPLAMQLINAEQLPTGTLPKEATYIEGFSLSDGRLIVSYSVPSKEGLFCKLILADGEKMTLLYDLRNGTTGPPMAPRVLLCARVDGKEQLFFSQPSTQGNRCVAIML